MESKEIICIVCPMGCKIQALISDQKLAQIKNAICKRGEEFAREEIENPARTLTSTVKLTHAALPRLPVRTASPVPKIQMQACIQAINAIVMQAPVHSGDLILKNIAETGVALIATRSVPGVN